MTRQEKFINSLLENYEKMEWSKEISKDFEACFGKYCIVAGTNSNNEGHYVRVYDTSSKETYVIYSSSVKEVNDLYSRVEDFVTNKDERDFWDSVQKSFDCNIVY